MSPGAPSEASRHAGRVPGRLLLSTIVLTPRFALVAILMIASALGASALRPTLRMADYGPPVDLQRDVPPQIGDWREEPEGSTLLVNPNVDALVRKTYGQVLNRTYRDPSGYRIMLSIAYGGDQSGDDLQLHRPEFCYLDQGFALLSNAVATIPTSFGALTVRRLVAEQGRRHEPITYWITVGRKATLPGIGRKLAQLSYGLNGKIPDGMLVRVSSVDYVDERSFQMQRIFVNDLLRSVEADFRARLAGAISP